MRYFMGLLLAVMLLSCGEDVQIRSNTNWKAEVNDRIIFGYGNMSINLPDENVKVVIQNTTKHGYIELVITPSNIFGTTETYRTAIPLDKIVMER